VREPSTMQVLTILQVSRACGDRCVTGRRMSNQTDLGRLSGLLRKCHLLVLSQRPDFAKLGFLA
jgi:hypothetical protein